MASIIYEKENGIAWITLNRPEAQNALDPEAMVRLADAWTDFKQDDTLYVAVLTGAGDKAFCSGADLKRTITLLTRQRPIEDEWDRRLIKETEITRKVFMRGFEMYKPVIAAVNGYCMAGGMEILLACDIRVAAENATFSLPEVTLALIPAGGSIARLPRLIPYCKAMEILLTGDRVDANEAYRIGMINYVVATDKVRETAEKLARKIASNGPLALRVIKETVLKSSGLPLEKGFELEEEGWRIVALSEDAKEANRAWREKRKPVFKGK